MSERKRGNVYVAAKNMRGKWADRPACTLVVDVTSAQSHGSPHRRDFSPMSGAPYTGPDGVRYLCFEHFWQAGKVFEHVPVQHVKEFFRSATRPTRRYPGSRGRRVLHASWDIDESTQRLDYVAARKRVYVPHYLCMVRDRPSLRKLREHLDSGRDLVIYDFDGPRLKKGETDPVSGKAAEEDGLPACMLVTPALLRAKIADVQFPFGHGYVVAAELAGIPLSQYCNE